MVQNKRSFFSVHQNLSVIAYRSALRCDLRVRFSRSALRSNLGNRFFLGQRYAVTLATGFSRVSANAVTMVTDVTKSAPTQ